MGILGLSDTKSHKAQETTLTHLFTTSDPGKITGRFENYVSVQYSVKYRKLYICYIIYASSSF